MDTSSGLHISCVVQNSLPGNTKIQDILQSGGLGINLVWPGFSWKTTQKKLCKWQGAKVVFVCFPVLSHGFLCWTGAITSCRSLKEKLKKKINILQKKGRWIHKSCHPPLQRSWMEPQPSKVYQKRGMEERFLKVTLSCTTKKQFYLNQCATSVVNIFLNFSNRTNLVKIIFLETRVVLVPKNILFYSHGKRTMFS